MLLPIALFMQATPPPAVTIQTRSVTPPATIAPPTTDRNRVVTATPRTTDAPAVFDVEVVADGVRLWSGAMRATSTTSAAYEQTATNAPPAECPRSVDRFAASYRSALRLNLQMIAGGPDATFKLTASWERPSPDRDCRNLGSATTSRTETFDLATGERHVVSGDGGLEVRVTRRR